MFLKNIELNQTHTNTNKPVCKKNFFRICNNKSL